MRDKTRDLKESPWIYLDHNGTTPADPEVVRTYEKWIRCFNASTNSSLAQSSKRVIEQATQGVLKHCGVTGKTHTVLFTSGASESNCMILRNTVRAARCASPKEVPHIVTSAIEHPSILRCLEDMEAHHEVTFTSVLPDCQGRIHVEAIEEALEPQTCLVTVMYVNNELPVIQPIADIAALCRERKIGFHCDAVQWFGKCRINMKKIGMTSLSASPHKFYGPKGAGLLLLENQWIKSRGITGEISGSQQHGLRGGTLNVPAIAATYKSIQVAFRNRRAKNQHLRQLRSELLESLRQHYPLVPYGSYLKRKSHAPLELISLGPAHSRTCQCVPHTILLSICKHTDPPFCNVKLKQFMDEHHVVVSIGSACSTSSAKASHVLEAIKAPPTVKRGVLRISFGDHTTSEEVQKFVKVLREGIETQV
jgi:cysteine desulfurase